MFLFLSCFFSGFYGFILVYIACILCVLPQSLKGEENERNNDITTMNSSGNINLLSCDFIDDNQVDRDNLTMQIDIKSGNLHSARTTSSNESEQGDCSITSETCMAEKCMNFPEGSSPMENDLSVITVSDLSTPILNTDMDRDEALSPSSFSESELKEVQ
jgi:hypothetical protein